MAIVNAFILYQRVPTVGKELTLKEFRVELAKQMIGTYNSRIVEDQQHEKHRAVRVAG